MNSSFRKGLACVLSFALVPIAAYAQDGTIDPDDLAAFLDGVIEARMKSHDVAGTTVSVVHDGRMIFASGYGFADIDNEVPVDADKTLFRPGSISKTFTWTAVMQLVEQGKLDLDADLREYVDDVDIPNKYGEPITMAHLMAHTPGLEATALGHLFEKDADKVLSLQEYLNAYPREQVREPGRTPAYSNWGTALAGHVVAKISGMSFEEYVEQYVLHPIGMYSSTFREPWGDYMPGAMSDELHTNASKGYQYRNGRFVESDYEFIHGVGPAGALSTTATDMARYMLMHLGDGSYDGVQILRPETARKMHSQHWAPNEGTSGWAHGFIVHDVAGYEGYGHAGGTLNFLSDMIMVPELDLGVFVSSNTPGGAQIMDGLVPMIVKRYFEDRSGDIPEPLDGFAERAAKITGSYVTTRRPYSVVESLLMAPGLVTTFAPGDDGHIVMAAGGNSIQWVEIEPWVFRMRDSTETMQFDLDESGNVVGVPMYLPAAYFEKVGAFDNPQTLLNLALLGIVVFAFAIVGAWLRRSTKPEQSVGERFAVVATLNMAGLWVLWAVVTGISIAPYVEDVLGAMYGFPTPLFKLGLAIALIATLSTVAAAMLLYPVWKEGSWSLWRRIRHTAVVLLGLVTVYALGSFDAIGFNYY